MKKGLEDIALSLQHNPIQPELLFLRGQYYYQQQNYPKSFSDFDLSYQVAPENQNLFAALCLIAEKNHGKALEYIQKTKSQSTEFENILISLALQNRQESLLKMNYLAPTIRKLDTKLQWLWHSIIPFLR